MPKRIGRLGWIPDLPDHRDQLFSPPPRVLQALPARFDITQSDPLLDFPIYDQGGVGSCTANALAAAVQFDRRKSGQSPDFVPSRLFLYYNERRTEGHVPYDSGAQLREGVKSLQQTGICPEADWPYIPTPPAFDGGPFPVGSPPVTTPLPVTRASSRASHSCREHWCPVFLSSLASASTKVGTAPNRQSCLYRVARRTPR
jgi:hypothetical protein